MKTAEEIREILSKNTEELLALIGSNAEQRGFGLSDSDDEDRGADWLQEKREELRKKVCGSRLAALAQDPDGGWDLVLLVAGIADLIAGICTGVSPVAVASLLLKMGLTKLCEDDACPTV